MKDYRRKYQYDPRYCNNKDNEEKTYIPKLLGDSEFWAEHKMSMNVDNQITTSFYRNFRGNVKTGIFVECIQQKNSFSRYLQKPIKAQKLNELSPPTSLQKLPGQPHPASMSDNLSSSSHLHPSFTPHPPYPSSSSLAASGIYPPHTPLGSQTSAQFASPTAPMVQYPNTESPSPFTGSPPSFETAPIIRPLFIDNLAKEHNLTENQRKKLHIMAKVHCICSARCYLCSWPYIVRFS